MYVLFTYRFFVHRNGTISSYAETVHTISAYKETVHILFLHTKKWYVRSKRLSAIHLRAISQLFGLKRVYYYIHGCNVKYELYYNTYSIPH